MIAAVIQTQASTDSGLSMERAARQIEQAAQQGAGLVVLPEYFGFLRASGKDPLRVEPLRGPTFAFLSACAQKHKLWIVGGSFYQKGAKGRVYNTSLLIDDQGNFLDYYQKIHLATAQGAVFPSSPSASYHAFSEETYLAHGRRQWVHPTPIGQLGIAICYDLRFPETVRGLRLLGAQAVAAPSAFFVSPGERQWEALIRARAIENQCYMLVAGQWGEYAPRRLALGFSMIVDPLGDILAACEPGPGVAMAEIDPDWTLKCRARIDYISQARMLPDRLRVKSG